MLHPLYNALVVFPVPVEFLDIESWLLFLQSFRKSFVFLDYLFFLLLPEDLIQAFIDLCPEIFGLSRGVISTSIHYTGYLIQQDPIFSIYLIFPNFLEFLLLAVIDGYGFGMLHEFGSDGPNFFHV